MTSVSRLIQTFTPKHYDLSLSLDRAAHTFEGVVTLQGTSATDATDIRVHSKDLKIKSIIVDGKSATFEHKDLDELHIYHPDIKGDTEHVVTIEFSGIITDAMNGIYPSYFEVDGEKKELLVTQFESHYARQAFPCIDEPEAKATFDVTLTTEKDIVVLGNMPIVSQNEENNRLVTTFQTTPRMSTYLVAWVAGELQKKSTTTKDDVEVSVWATAAQSPESLDFALEFATRTIEFFDEYFGVPYPLPKSDHVAIPDFSAGAMENWGLITYREIALLVDPKTTTLSTKHYVATVVAHELSHQWFGNLVTMKWWNDLWLNESFANMMEYVAVDALEPSWNVWLDFATAEVISALRRDSLDGVQSIQIDVTHPDEIQSIFDPSIVYAKGGRLLRMLQAYIGSDALRAGLKHYFEKHQYTNTQADDLWAALSEASGKDIGSFMHSWMTQPGFPVVDASRDGDTITLSQKQFFIGPHDDADRSWPIPLHGASPSIPDMLQAKELSFEYTDKTPFRLNVGSTAHFITRYDDELRAELIANLDTLSSIDKLGFLHEQLLLAKAGLISYADIIPLLSFFKDEENESVWSIVALAINELKRFVETDEGAEKKLRQLVNDVADTQYRRIGWTAKSDEDENDTKLRSLIIGLVLYGENPDALATAKELYHTTPLDELDPELRCTIMAQAVRDVVAPDVIDVLLDAYAKSNNSELRDDIAAALTSTKDSATIERLAGLLKNTEFIRQQDFSHWFVWLLRNRYGRTYMWQWLRDNWNWVVETFESDKSYDMIPRYIATSLTTATQRDEFKAFFGPLESDIALVRNITIGYTELDGTIELLETDSPRVHKALLNLQ